MTSKPEEDDIVDRAVLAMRGAMGPDEPPRDLVERVRRYGAARQALGRERPLPVQALRDPTSRGRVAWMPLTAAVAVMVLCGWLVAFHKSLFSHEAGRRLAPDGMIYRQYTDGRVRIERRPPAAESREQLRDQAEKRGCPFSTANFG
jgi:hypothetical protein